MQRRLPRFTGERANCFGDMPGLVFADWFPRWLVIRDCLHGGLEAILRLGRQRLELFLGDRVAGNMIFAVAIERRVLRVMLRNGVGFAAPGNPSDHLDRALPRAEQPGKTPCQGRVNPVGILLSPGVDLRQRAVEVLLEIRVAAVNFLVAPFLR